MKKTILTHVIALTLISLNTFADSGEGRSGPDRSGVSIPVSADRVLTNKEFNKFSSECSAIAGASILRQVGATDESYLGKLESGENLRQSNLDDSRSLTYSKTQNFVISASNPRELRVGFSLITTNRGYGAPTYGQKERRTTEGSFEISASLPNGTEPITNRVVIAVSDAFYTTLMNAIKSNTDLTKSPVVFVFSFETAELIVTEELAEDPFGIPNGVGRLVSSINYKTGSKVYVTAPGADERETKLIYNSEPFIQCMNNKIGN